MTTLTKGGNAPVPTGRLGIEVSYRPSAGIPEIDVSGFLLRADGKVSGDADMVFYGQPEAHSGAVALEGQKSGADGRGIVRFAVSAADLPSSVERITFAATIHEAEAKGLSFAGVGGLEICVLSGMETLVRFPVDGVGGETSLILGELYRRQGAWKFRAVAQGYAGGLKPLAESYGMDISPPEAPPPPVAVAPAPPVPPPPASVVPAVPPAPPVSLSKISLTKANPKISLAKRGDAYGEVTINLNWSRSSGSGWGGLFPGRKSGIDLDVGCLFEMADGQKGGVQALGDSYGDFDAPPYILLSGDDRTGERNDGEWIRVNGRRFEAIRRILVYAFIYEGAPNWRATDGVVTVTVPGSAPVEVRLDDGNDASTMCAVALVENVDGQMRISREVRYFRGHKDMDQAYRWGLKWVAGSKD